MTKKEKFLKRKKRVAAKISGTAKRPRVSVFKSNKDIYAQIIDDVKGHTLASFSSKNIKDTGKKTKTEIAGLVGEALAKSAKAKKITEVVFDRSGFKYHGRVKALAEGARKGGLKF
jgi:large subunit ribosomal protein L18